MIEKISYSAFKDFQHCPYYYKLVHIDKLYSVNNEYVAYGKAMHDTARFYLEDKTIDPVHYFNRRFGKLVCDLVNTIPEIKEDLVENMFNQSPYVINQIKSAFKNYFGTNYRIFGSEYRLQENYDGIIFKGFIDSIVISDDGKYNILDFKTTSWGWPPEKKGDKLLTYQLTLYKFMFIEHMLELGIDIGADNVETHFCLLKRTAKKDNVELFRVSSGEKKTTNALTMLNQTITYIKNNKFMKNRYSCKNCNLYQTELCH